jgi:hypothetical protein
MGAFRILRNVIGTAGMVFAGYIFLTSIKDAGRYIRLSRM